MARTFSGNADGTVQTLTITGAPAHEVYVKNNSPDEDLLVNIPAIHGTDFDILNPGDSDHWSNPNYGESNNIRIGSIDEIKLRTAGPSAAFTAGVTRGQL